MTLPKYEFFSVFPSLKKEYELLWLYYYYKHLWHDYIHHDQKRDFDVLIICISVLFFLSDFAFQKTPIDDCLRKALEYSFFPRKINWVLKVLFSCSTGLKNRHCFLFQNKIFFFVFYDMFGFSSIFQYYLILTREWPRG